MNLLHKPSVAIVAAAALGAVLAAIIANAGGKVQLATFALCAFSALLLATRDRRQTVLLLFVLGIQFPLYKAVGPLDLTNDGGAPGFYITTEDVLLIVLYVLWARQGTLIHDLRALLADRGVLVPLIALFAVVPSLFAAPDLAMATAEWVRLAFGAALYLYIACNVRMQRDINVILVGFMGVVMCQFPLMMWQWKVGEVPILGLAGFATNPAVDRVSLAGETFLRPNGTLFHPTVAGVVLIPLGLILLSAALSERFSRLWKMAAIGSGLAAIFAICVIAQARASMLGLAVGGAILAVVLARRERVIGRLAYAAALILPLFILAAQGPIGNFLGTNLGTSHFGLEIEARAELNGVAMRLVEDAPLFGVGLNNYMMVVDQFTPNGVLFPGFPAHNLYLLTWAETGTLGLLSVLAIFVALLRYAIRLARVPNRSLALLGTGLAVSYAFFMVEETLAYSLRHTHGTILFWLLAGLTIAGWRMATVHEPVAQTLPQRIGPEHAWPRLTPVPVGSAIIGRKALTLRVVTKE